MSTKNPLRSVVSPNKDLKKLNKAVRTNSLKTVNPCTAKHKIVEIYIVYKILSGYQEWIHRKWEKANSRCKSKVKTRSAPNHLLRTTRATTRASKGLAKYRYGVRIQLRMPMLPMRAAAKYHRSTRLNRTGIENRVTTEDYRRFLSKIIWSKRSSPFSRNKLKVLKMSQEAVSWARTPQIIRRDRNLDNEIITHLVSKYWR